VGRWWFNGLRYIERFLRNFLGENVNKKKKLTKMWCFEIWKPQLGSIILGREIEFRNSNSKLVVFKRTGLDIWQSHFPHFFTRNFKIERCGKFQYASILSRIA